MKTFIASLLHRMGLCLLVFCTAYQALAQPAGWSHVQVFELKETRGAMQTDFPLLLDVNTKALIQAGYMKTDGGDIRFGFACNNNAIPYWIESGINTEHTSIWLRIPSLAANAAMPIYMSYGNPTASGTGNKSAIFKDSIKITASTTLSPLDTIYRTGWFEISGSTIDLSAAHPGKVQVIADKILIKSSVLNGDYKGFEGGLVQENGKGPGGGGKATDVLGSGGGGGGYGGNGGKGCGATLGEQGAAGPKYGTDNGLEIQRGSGGGGGDQGQGGAGGGAFSFIAQSVQMTASTIRVRGENGPPTGSSAGGGGGGGSGGGVLMIGRKVDVQGAITAHGGDGSPAGNWPGGGGSGGRVKLAHQGYVRNAATVNIAGGIVYPPFDNTDPPAETGELGVLSLIPIETYFHKVTKGLSASGGVSLKSNTDTLIKGDTLILTAKGTNPEYEFLKNGSVVQSGTDSIYLSHEVNDFDVFLVRNFGGSGSCAYVSDSRTIFVKEAPIDTTDTTNYFGSKFTSSPIYLYPNPAKDRVLIQGDFTPGMEFQVLGYHPGGTLIFAHTLQAQQGVLDCPVAGSFGGLIWLEVRNPYFLARRKLMVVPQP